MLLYMLAALVFGYLLGSIPVRPHLHPHGGLRRYPQGRLRQYRRHERAAHRAQGPCRRDLARRRAEGHRAVLIAALWGPQFAIVAALGAFFGHLFPVWLGFKGGKGVATFIGVLLGLKPLAALPSR